MVNIFLIFLFFSAGLFFIFSYVFTYESAHRECKRLRSAGGYYRIKKVWYGWIVVEVK